MGKQKHVRITTGDIYKAYVTLLKKHFKGVNIMNVVKDYPRPAFFPKLTVSEVDRTTAKQLDSRSIMRLYYFPENKDNSMVELANMQDKLIDVFWLEEQGMININGVNIEFNEIDFLRVEDVLHCYIEMNIGHGLVEAKASSGKEAPLMEDLHYKKEGVNN